VLGETLAIRGCPPAALVWLSFGLRSRRAPCEERAGRAFPDRVWAIEGCAGIGKPIAHRLVHDGETVFDVPPKLSARVRVFATGNDRKTDPVDAHSVAVAALRAPNLVQVQVDPDLVVMGMLADRRDELGRARMQTLNRLHRLLLGFSPAARSGCWPPSRLAGSLPPSSRATSSARPVAASRSN
jgi:hypothetical protein